MKRRGFTLIELIIVLAIIGLGFGISVLKFSIVDKIGAKNEIQTFIDDYSYVRSLSLSSGKVYSINISENTYEISGPKEKTRNLKYIKSNNTTVISFDGSGYVKAVKTKEGHNLVFVSKKDPEIKWYFTIEAVGGYLSEKNK